MLHTMRVQSRLYFAGSLLASTLLSAPSFADTLTIRRPGAHPRYAFEAEPHLTFGAFPAPGPANGSGYGVGFRGTLELIDNGFISSINNSIGIGFGADWVHYKDSSLPCPRAPDTGNCADLSPDFSINYVYVPVVMQWNFWLSRDWSVFGEPGLELRFATRGEDRTALDPFVLFVGGRYHFSERIALTMRAGYPTFSVGASFLL